MMNTDPSLSPPSVELAPLRARRDLLTPPDGVVFDMDGVLADTRLLHLKAFQELVAPFGVDLTEEWFQKLFGLDNRRFIAALFGKEMPDGEWTALADQKEANYRSMVADRIELLAGIRPMVAALHASGRPMAVGSSAPRANVEQILEASGIRPMISAVLAAEDVVRHKPHPDVFLKAMDKIGLTPERCWVVEDSVYGLQAALRSNANAVAVATTHPADELQFADAVFPSPLELWRHLEPTL
ncbi:MAG: HAD family hydrolase [Planctomycetia bacterium]